MCLDMCVCVCLYICAEWDTGGGGGVSHPPVIELAELWLNTRQGTDRGKKKAECITLPRETGEHISETDRLTVGVSSRCH